MRSLRTSVVVIAVACALSACSRPALAVDDPCGGTGGNGRVVRVDTTGFTMERSGDHRDQVVHLAPRAEIRTASGPGSLSDVKVGERLTLVGGPNADGSFTADTVVVCMGGQEPQGQADSSHDGSSRTARPAKAEVDRVSRAINATTIVLCGAVWLGLLIFLRRKKMIGIVYGLFFSMFALYVYKVLDYTLLQFQSLLLLQHFVHGLMLNGVPAGRTANLIPLVTLTSGDVRTSLFNVLMMVPFGFGLPFITNLRLKRVVLAAFLFSLTIEALQFITGFLANTTFRIADVNDLIFNTLGAAVGYLLFRVFVRMVRVTLRGRSVMESPILRYIDQRPQAVPDRL